MSLVEMLLLTLLVDKNVPVIICCFLNIMLTFIQHESRSNKNIQLCTDRPAYICM